MVVQIVVSVKMGFQGSMGTTVLPYSNAKAIQRAGICT